MSDELSSIEFSSRIVAFPPSNELHDILCFIDVDSVLSNEFCRSLRRIDAVNCRPGDPFRVRESRRVIVDICCDSMDRLAAFDRVREFRSDHSGNRCSNEFSRDSGAPASSNELKELFCLICIVSLLFPKLCIGGDKSKELRLSGN